MLTEALPLGSVGVSERELQLRSTAKSFTSLEGQAHFAHPASTSGAQMT